MTSASTNVEKARQRNVPAGTYRWSCAFGLQPRFLERFLDDIDVGVPQRFVLFSGETSLGAVVEALDAGETFTWPEPIRLDVGAITRQLVETAPRYVDVPKAVSAEIRASHEAKTRALHADEDLDPLCSHHELNRLKIATCLAVLEGRANIDEDDWRLAGDVMAVSLANWRTVRAQIERRRRAEEVARREAVVRTNVATARALEADAVETTADKVASIVVQHPEGITRAGRSRADHPEPPPHLRGGPRPRAR